MIKKKIFDNPSEAVAALCYFHDLIKLVKNQGFDSKCVKYIDVIDHSGLYRYHDTIEVYIDSTDESLINSLKLTS